jgi:hypothetical protein
MYWKMRAEMDMLHLDRLVVVDNKKLLPENPRINGSAANGCWLVDEKYGVQKMKYSRKWICR